MSQRLGQHFLKNRGKIREIVDSLELKRGDVVVEVGAGHGELTEELRIRNNELSVIAIEKDERLANNLQSKLKTENIEIIHGDALKLLPTLITNYKLPVTSYKIVGNIPYYITGKLLRVIGDLITNYELPITTIVLTVQKEVAERITAKPPRMNLLAASVQFWAEPEIVGFIPKKDFSPPPEVDSAIVKLITRKPNYQLLITNYYKLVRALFKQPRKTISNNLSAGLGLEKEKLDEKLEAVGVNPGDRPQNLSVEEIIKITRNLYVLK